MKPFVIFIHASGEPLSPEMATTTGLTGAEEVLVFLSNELSRLGYRVAVCVNNTGGRQDRIVNGVRWTDWSYPAKHNIENDPTGENTVLVVSMYPNLIHDPVLAVPFRARRKIMWPHSAGFDDVLPETWGKYDNIVCATNWQAQYLLDAYIGGKVTFRVGPPPIAVVPYGIPPMPDVPKVPGKAIYASSPDRGLYELLKMWPDVVRDVPSAHLFVAYGRDRWKAHQPEKAATLEALLAETPNVTDLGFVSYEDINRHLAEAEVWAYPTSFLETGCLVGRRAVAAGTMPVFTDSGCLSEVLAPNTPVRSEAFHDVLIATLRGLPRHGPFRTPQTTWAEAARLWEPLLALSAPEPVYSGPEAASAAKEG